MIFFIFLAALALAALWLAVFTKAGIIPASYWKDLWSKLAPAAKTEHRVYKIEVEQKDGSKFERETDDKPFHTVFDMMDSMNVSEIESFGAYGHRTFYFKCRKCGQKNRLGDDLAKFKDAGCGKCHTKFARQTGSMN